MTHRTRHRQRLLAVIFAAIVLTPIVWIGSRVYVRYRQNQASLAMMVVVEHIGRHIERAGAWPTSWADLAVNDWTSEHIAVDWSASISDLTDLLAARAIGLGTSVSELENTVPPVLVRYQNVPRDHDLDRDELFWNRTLLKRVAQALYERASKEPTVTPP